MDSARLDAEILAAHALGIERLELYLQFERPLSEEERAAIRTLVRRRGDHEPVAYLVGTREFYSLTFEVGPGVLVPRPETEHLVEVALAECEGVEAPVFADVGVGSGCVAVTLLHERPTARGHATDVSGAALAAAAANAARHGVTDRLVLHQGDLLAPLAGDPDWGHLDAVVSNPPYILRDDPQVDPGVRDHEPPEALFVPDDDALAFVRRIAAAARDGLKAGGLLAFEVGAGSADEARRVLRGEGYVDIGVTPDLAKIDRVVHAHRP